MFINTIFNNLLYFSGVDEDFYPYEGIVTNCSTRPIFKSQIYKMGPAYALNKESDIMWEILHHGPVQGMNKIYNYSL